MHLEEDDVLVWLLSEGGLPADLQRHAAGCPECSARLREGEQFREALSSHLTWENQSHRALDTSFLDRLSKLEERLERESFEAESSVTVLSHDELLRHIAVAGGTVGLVRTLVDRSYDAVERSPQEGERYASLATLAADLLHSHDYPENLIFAARGQAWRQMANAHRMSGKLPDALRDLDHAAAAFEHTTVSEPELATLDYIRATVFYTQGRLGEARTLLESATSVFGRYGDDERHRNSRLLLGSVLERDGDRDEAIRMLHELLNDVPTDAPTFRGRVLHNLGVALLHDADDRAETYLQQAHHCLVTAGLRTEALRALWNLGRAARQREELDRAIIILAEAYEEASVLGLQIDVAMIALDRAEIYLTRNEIELVRSLCQDAIRTFTAANAPRFTADAFAYLEAAARREQLTPADLAFVRDFFTTAEPARDTPFTPPPN